MWEEEKAFGRVLRAHRIRAELSQEGLAFEAALARNYVSQLELGKKSPSLRTIFRICRVLQISPTQLMDDVERSLRSDAADGVA